ncbi:MAG: hypothetical protein M0Z76_03255 [Gammaproteobacteria bacterium]|nr:hypothetical protein [Gammaproteobacteria bacterium]
MICAIPAFRALRNVAPGAVITLIGAPSARAFAQRFRCYIDEFLAFPGHPDLDGRAHRDEFNNFVDYLNTRFDWLIQLHGDGHVTNSILARFKADHRAGFVSHPQAVEGDFIIYPSGHESERLLTLMRHLGAEGHPRLEWPITEQDHDELMHQSWRIALGKEPYIVVDTDRTWRGANGLRHGIDTLVERLASQFIIVVTNTNANRPRSDGRTIHAQALSPGALGALISGARLIIAAESGAGHIAHALSVPSLTIVTGSDPERWCRNDDPRHPYVDARMVFDADRAWTLIGQATRAGGGCGGM